MTVTLPAVKCAVIKDESEFSDMRKSAERNHLNENDSQLALMLIVTMPDGKTITLLLKQCERGQVQLKLPDES